MSSPLSTCYWSQAPLRISFAGGGTDVRPYCDIYGGAVVNATIDLYARAQLTPHLETTRVLKMINKGTVPPTQSNSYQTALSSFRETGLDLDADLSLPKAVIDYVENRFGSFESGFELIGQLDVEKCSGLGSSSALVVAFLAVLLDWKKIPHQPFALAAMAVDVERNWMHWPGGLQDQYAAALGGINFMEFQPHNQVTVTPIRLSTEAISVWQNQLVLYYSGLVRPPQQIIETQQSHVMARNEIPLQAMHAIRAQADQFKQILENAAFDQIGPALHAGFLQKKKMAEGISNSKLDELYNRALVAGARGGKISGAGGGGFMFFDCAPEKQAALTETLRSFGGQLYPLQFTMQGVSSWQSINSAL